MNRPNRKINRLKHYNYSQSGWYFVTICVKNHRCYLGDILNGKMRFSKIGLIAKQCWLEIPIHFPGIRLDEHTIMPNHIHGVIVINNVGNNDRCSLQQKNRNMELLPKVISQYKSSVTREVRKKPNNHQFAWQRSFYDHIIRNEESLNDIREYIINNPLKWKLDKYNPRNF